MRAFFIRGIIGIILIYQKTLSSDHGAGKYIKPHHRCIFYPSCSQYMIDAIEKRGLFVGITKGLYRILRCNPFNKGGVDLAD